MQSRKEGVKEGPSLLIVRVEGSKISSPAHHLAEPQAIFHYDAKLRSNKPIITLTLPK